MCFVVQKQMSTQVLKNSDFYVKVKDLENQNYSKKLN